MRQYEKRPPIKWKKVNKRTPCPVCEKSDWCGISEDESVSRCMRVQSDTPSVGTDGATGYIHQVGDPVDRLLPAREYKQPQKVDMSSLYALYATKSGNTASDPLAARWGLPSFSVRSLHTVWIGAHQAYGIPMWNELGEVIGIQLRGTDSKWTIKGSQLGIFCSWPILSKRVFVCEGASDTAAMISLGFTAVGRASCNSGGPILKRMLEGKDVVIVSDNDQPQQLPNGNWVTPGQDGATQLSYQLAKTARSVRIITPPSPYKDARQWVNSGVSKKQIETACKVAYQI